MVGKKLVFPRTAGNTGYSQGNIGNSQELLGNKLLTNWKIICTCIFINSYTTIFNHYKSTFYQTIKQILITIALICVHSCNYIAFLVRTFRRRVCIHTCLSLSVSCHNTLSCKVPIVMPPTSEKLRGHIGLGLSVSVSVRLSVILWQPRKLKNRLS